MIPFPLPIADAPAPRSRISGRSEDQPAPDSPSVPFEDVVDEAPPRNAAAEPTSPDDGSDTPDATGEVVIAQDPATAETATAETIAIADAVAKSGFTTDTEAEGGTPEARSVPVQDVPRAQPSGIVQDLDGAPAQVPAPIRPEETEPRPVRPAIVSQTDVPPERLVSAFRTDPEVGPLKTAEAKPDTKATPPLPEADLPARKSTAEVDTSTDARLGERFPKGDQPTENVKTSGVPEQIARRAVEDQPSGRPVAAIADNFQRTDGLEQAREGRIVRQDAPPPGASAAAPAQVVAPPGRTTGDGTQGSPVP